MWESSTHSFMANIHFSQANVTTNTLSPLRCDLHVLLCLSWLKFFHLMSTFSQASVLLCWAGNEPRLDGFSYSFSITVVCPASVSTGAISFTTKKMTKLSKLSIWLVGDYLGWLYTDLLTPPCLPCSMSSQQQLWLLWHQSPWEYIGLVFHWAWPPQHLLYTWGLTSLWCSSSACQINTRRQPRKQEAVR